MKRTSKAPWAEIYSPNGAGESTLYTTVIEPTYQKLLISIRKELKEDSSCTAYVVRTKRGEWGQWFEKWRTCGRKIEKYEEGWL